MQVRCIRPRAGVKAGDTAGVPDGAQVSGLYWEPVSPPPPPPPPAPAVPAPASTKGPAS